MAHWADATIDRFVEQLSEIDRVLDLSIVGIARLSKSADLVKALAAYEKHRNPAADAAELSRGVERAEKEASLARSEVEHGFPLLHAQATVALWSALEAFVEDLVVAALLNNPTALTDKRLSPIKVSIAEFQVRDPEDRMRLLVRELARQSKADLSDGLTRFELILAPIAMSGALETAVRRSLFELSQIRHVLVHRSAMIDRKLTESCPWLSLTTGARLLITGAKFQEYSAAVSNYLFELLRRELVSRGISRAEAEKIIAARV